MPPSRQLGYTGCDVTVLGETASQEANSDVGGWQREELRIAVAIPWGIEGHEVSWMKFHAPLFAIFLGLDGQKSESSAKSIYPKRPDFDVPKCDSAKLGKASLDGVVDYTA